MLQLSIRAFPALIICFLIVLVVLSQNVLIKLASAHITKKFGSIQVQVGWNGEPPLTGQLNSVII